MEPCMQTVDKHLEKFSQFANHFSRAFIPIVETAIKMSSGEPVSAYGVFKAAKVMADANKKSKKKSTPAKAGNKKQGSSNKKGGKRKLACAETNGGGNSTKSLAVKNNNTKSQAKTTKKPNAKGQNKKENGTTFKGSEVISMVDTFYPADGKKKLSKAEQKKKEELEDYLVKQLEMDDNDMLTGEEYDEDSFDSECDEEEESLTNTSAYTDEYTLNETGSYSEGEEEEEEESSSTNDEDNQKADALAQAILSKANNKKRKSPEPQSETDNKSQHPNGNLEAKKLKKATEDTIKGSMRKSLPNEKTEKSADATKRRGASLNSLEEQNKKSSSSNTTTVNVKLEPLSPPSNVVKLNSIEEGKRAFKWLLNPVSVEDFFKKFWEHKACLIKRQQDSYFKHLISFEAIDQMLIKNHVEFTKNIDVTSYTNGKHGWLLRGLRFFLNLNLFSRATSDFKS